MNVFVAILEPSSDADEIELDCSTHSTRAGAERALIVRIHELYQDGMMSGDQAAEFVEANEISDFVLVTQEELEQFYSGYLEAQHWYTATVFETPILGEHVPEIPLPDGWRLHTNPDPDAQLHIVRDDGTTLRFCENQWGEYFVDALGADNSGAAACYRARENRLFVSGVDMAYWAPRQSIYADAWNIAAILWGPK